MIFSSAHVLLPMDAERPSSLWPPRLHFRAVARDCRSVLQLRHVKTYIHARLGERDRATLDELKAATGQTESQIVRRGLQLVAREERGRRSALELAGRSVGRFEKGPLDLSANRKHLEGFGA